MENVKPTKKEEKELIKRVFGNNEKLLKSIYRLFIGLDVPESEKERIKEVFTNEQLREILRQRLLPNLRDDVPIGAVSDEWGNIDQMIFGQTKDTILQAVQRTNVAIKYTKQALKLLENPYEEKLNLDFDPDANIMEDELQIRLLGRNLFIRNCATQLQGLWTIANMPDEGVKKEDSSK